MDNTAGVKCYHCGLDCGFDSVSDNDKIFCCPGCKTVFSILKEYDLSEYYSLNEHPGQSPSESALKNKFAYLDEKSVQDQILDFSDGSLSRTTLYVPAIHCSSCIWILESLYRLDPGIKNSLSNFVTKEVTVSWFNDKTSFRKIVELLSSLGYEPEINFEAAVRKAGTKTRKRLIGQLGVAGFALGNIMLLSLPEYLSGSKLEPSYATLFGYLNIILSIPVLFYSASGYFKSAIGGLRHKTVNIDVPIMLGILALYLRSLYEILLTQGAGYLDSFTGFVFFLLLGKLFQEKTYQSMSFDRDFRSYFPIVVTVIEKGKEKFSPLSELKAGVRIILRNNEIIPADAVIIKGEAQIDYSFVTGESVPVHKLSGDRVFAGGRHHGSSIEIEVIKDVSQSYLTSLWNEDIFSKDRGVYIDTIANTVSKYFTAVVITIATATGIYWLNVDSGLGVNAFTSVLIIACPCALALSVPFTLGNAMRILGKKGFYLKNTHVIERMANITTILFDKTGTLTDSLKTTITFLPSEEQNDLSIDEINTIRSLVNESSHPLSRLLSRHLENGGVTYTVENFEEFQGMGISGTIKGTEIRIGSSEFMEIELPLAGGTVAIVMFNGKVRGVFHFSNSYRKGIASVIRELQKRYSCWLLSGDNDGERRKILTMFNDPGKVHFNQSSFDKLNVVKHLQKKGESVLMTGDGLNDAGALKAGDVGLSVSDNINSFSPACDSILDSGQVQNLWNFLKFSRTAMLIIKISFVISFLYNLIGLFFAIQGLLSPLLSAILMPLSSISVVIFTTVVTRFAGRKL